ncbi:helix-turn-helix domain-containing protein [Streptomyces sp. NPDC048484]|uniref:helix-turn-helix domain-containing protein n=1 Tax=Streptomyces sp. NPDC048484 TaxID=3155146 RepID=UPI00342CEF85
MPRNPKEGPPPEPPEGYVWSDEAARRMSITRRTLWNWRQTGKGPKAKRYRGRLIYATADIKAHIEAELEAAELEEEARVRNFRPPEPRLSRRGVGDGGQ